MELTKASKSSGRWANPWKEWRDPGLGGLLKWQFTKDDQSDIPKPEVLDVTLPVENVDIKAISSPPEHGMRVTWIGHATVLAQFDGISVLTDPVFSERASPSSYFGPKRYRPVPCQIADIPTLDAVVISHNHYDHLDYSSVVQLNKKFGPKLRWYVPMGLKSWMQDSGCKNVVEMSWWDEHTFHDSDNAAAAAPSGEGNMPNITFACVPACHWSTRKGPMFDANKVLWSGWAVIGPRYKFYFAGDTGYCEAFKQIGHKYGPFNLAAIPIGAYEPRWFMQPQHINPEEAVKVHMEVKANKSLGIHWGTFKLTDEFYLEPRTKVSEVMKEMGLKVEDFFTLKHGETRDLEFDSGDDASPKSKV